MSFAISDACVETFYLSYDVCRNRSSQDMCSSGRFDDFEDGAHVVFSCVLMTSIFETRSEN
jgi:hypothetical protein